MQRVLVTGAGGFVGHPRDVPEGTRVLGRGVDLKYPEFTDVDADEFELLDLRRRDDALVAVRDVDEVYALARHGRHGVHLEQSRDDPAQQRPHQPPHHRGGSDSRCRAIPLQLLGVRLS